MVAAGNARKETALKAELPGDHTEEQAAVVELPDEIEIVVTETGMVLLNEEALDQVGTKGLPQLTKGESGCRKHLR